MPSSSNIPFLKHRRHIGSPPSSALSRGLGPRDDVRDKGVQEDGIPASSRAACACASRLGMRCDASETLFLAFWEQRCAATSGMPCRRLDWGDSMPPSARGGQAMRTLSGRDSAEQRRGRRQVVRVR